MAYIIQDETLNDIMILYQNTRSNFRYTDGDIDLFCYHSRSSTR